MPEAIGKVRNDLTPEFFPKFIFYLWVLPFGATTTHRRRRLLSGTLYIFLNTYIYAGGYVQVWRTRTRRPRRPRRWQQEARPRKGSSYSGTGAAAPKHKGLCAALGTNVFDYGQKAAADQMRTTWDKIVHHVGTIYGSDISNELLNKKRVQLPEPDYTDEVKDKHEKRVKRHSVQQE